MISVGDYYTFGSYEQDNDLTNGSEPIEWQVLDVQDGEALLLSRYALASKPFEENKNSEAWESCSLRAWLNGEFYDAVFTRDEKASIIDGEVQAEKNPKYGTSSGNNTEDKVFLLSVPEAEIYFSTSKGDCARPQKQEKRILGVITAAGGGCGQQGTVHPARW